MNLIEIIYSFLDWEPTIYIIGVSVVYGLFQVVKGIFSI